MIDLRVSLIVPFGQHWLSLQNQMQPTNEQFRTCFEISETQLPIGYALELRWRPNSLDRRTAWSQVLRSCLAPKAGRVEVRCSTV